MRLGEVLIKHKALTEDQLQLALDQQSDRGGRIGEVAIAQGYVTPAQVAKALAEQLGLDYMEELPKERDMALLQNIPLSFAKQYKFLPLGVENGVVRVATSDPLELMALDDLRIVLGMRYDLFLVPYDILIKEINQVYSDLGFMGADLGEEDQQREESDEEEDIVDLLDAGLDDEAFAIRFVNQLLFRALKQRASDIHVEPMENDVAVRYRIDGVLHEIVRLKKRWQNSVTSRIKIMGNLNIAEKRLPQDGRIRLKVAGKDIDIRLSTLPTSYGERSVMRLLDRSAVLLSMDSLGFMNRQFKQFEQLIAQPHGIILVTGPTGSGKTTTLYSALSAINTPDKNIITVEDPVEYQLPGIGQVPVNHKINMTFASALRSILRQDPDVIMIGEIRDLETAEIAVQSSLTGHLVLSTIHTNDSASTVTRLVDMGVESFLVATSVIGIMAQRLIRTLCTCKETYVPTETELRSIDAGFVESLLSGPPIYKANGCDECGGTGYRGRKGIYELLMVDEGIQDLILRKADAAQIKKQALEKGMLNLRQDGLTKVQLGWTTLDEVMRVTQDEIVSTD